MALRANLLSGDTIGNRRTLAFMAERCPNSKSPRGPPRPGSSPGPGTTTERTGQRYHAVMIAPHMATYGGAGEPNQGLPDGRACR